MMPIVENVPTKTTIRLKAIHLPGVTLWERLELNPERCTVHDGADGSCDCGANLWVGLPTEALACRPRDPGSGSGVARCCGRGLGVCIAHGGADDVDVPDSK